MPVATCVGFAWAGVWRTYAALPFVEPFWLVQPSHPQEPVEQPPSQQPLLHQLFLQPLN